MLTLIKATHITHYTVIDNYFKRFVLKKPFQTLSEEKSSEADIGKKYNHFFWISSRKPINQKHLKNFKKNSN